jgi:Cof subfamily protein (haloacid dehalogenase superfamily)
MRSFAEQPGAVAAPRLIATDLDGTLLRSDGTVSHRTRRALAAVRAHGMPVVLVSARHPAAVAEVARDAQVGGFAVCSNGGSVFDLDTGSLVRTRSIETEVATRLVKALRQRAPGVLFAVEVHAELAFEPGFNAWDDWEAPEGTRHADALELVAEPVVRLICRHEDYALDVLAELVTELVGDAATVVMPGSWTVEVSAPGVDKGTTLAELCRELGIDASEVVAIGDYPNDLPMLAWARRGIAMGNAHPAVLAAADEVTASNDEDGVALVLEGLIEPD